MATTMTDRARLWNERVAGANKVYTTWEKTFNVLKLEDYYLGLQKRFGDSYVVNRCGPTLDTKQPAYMYWSPRAVVTPKDGFPGDPAKIAAAAQLREDFINAFVEDEDEYGFFRETSLAVKEAHYRFAVVEVGYTGDYIDNPNAGRPLLDKDKKAKLDGGGQPIPQPGRILNPENPNPESIYVKRIPAATFRVSI